MTQPSLLSRPPARAVAYLIFAVLFLVQIQVVYVASGSGPVPFAHADKVVHVAIFALPSVIAGALRSPALLSVLVLHALISEPAQHLLTSGRQMDLWDTLADLFGIAVGGMVGALLFGRAMQVA